MIPRPNVRPSAAPVPSDPEAAAEEAHWRVRFRRAAAAWLLGAAVVVWPAWPTASQQRASRRPAFERALTWRDFIRLRLSPWLLMQDAERRVERGQPPEI